MGRKNVLLDSSFSKALESDIKKFPNSDIFVKLKALHASLTHTDSLVAEVFDISRSTLSRWKSNYVEEGVDGLKNKPKGHNPSKLNPEKKEIIKQWVISSEDSKGQSVHWTIKRLMKEIDKVFDIQIAKTPLWLTLRSMNLSLKKPRPQHHKSDAASQEEFKKNSRND